MAISRDFWSQDRTTIHQKSGWFGKLPTLQKICYILLLAFLIGWCFYLGMSYAFATAPKAQWTIKDGSEWKPELTAQTGEQVVRLTGVDVALIVGADKRPGETRYRTDTIILAFYNWDTDQLQLLSIPRDTYVQFPGRPTKTKINEAYFYGGLPLLESVIEYTFGIEVDHTVQLDFSGFLQMIDALGGVDVDVPYRMYKPTEDINIKKGPQTLNGYDALAFVRFRDLPMGDIDRIQDQQMFIHALAAKIAGSSIWKAPQLVDIGLKYTETNYSLTDALTLGAALVKTDLSDIPMYSLPGNGLYIGMISYWILNKQSTIDMITKITGGEVGDFHIINDGGKGTEKPPVPVQEDQPAEVQPGDTTPDGTVDGEQTPPAEGTDNGQPPADQSLGPDGQPLPANPAETPQTDQQQTQPDQQQPQPDQQQTQPDQQPQPDQQQPQSQTDAGGGEG